MRAAWGLVLLLGCACGPAPSRAPLVASTPVYPTPLLPIPTPLPAHQLAALQTIATSAGPIYWRLRTPDGPRCELWRFEPDLEDPTRGHLTRSDGPLRLRFAHQIADGRLRLHTPELERERVTGAGLSTTVVALPCVFSAMSLTALGAATARQLVLTSHERWFISLEACAAAGPDLDPQPSVPGELHPLGCPSALADPGTRARHDPPSPPSSSSPPSPASARLRASKRLYWLRDRGGHHVCELWQHQPDDQPQRGLLRRSDRAGSTIYGYATGPALLTLMGPSHTRRVRGPDGPADLARARSCLLTRPFTLTPDALRFGHDLWYLRRRDCERARQAGAPTAPDPDCGPALKPQ